MAVKKSTPKRVAQYIRVSTLEQAREGSSLEGQENSLKDLIKSNFHDKNWVTNKNLIYIDDGYSGADDERPEYRRMMKDAQEGKFEVVLVWKIDRLFRKTILLLGAIEKLQKLGIEFVSKNESIDTSTTLGRFSLTVLGAIAEMERETIRERTIMGKVTKAKKGFYVGGKYPPYGYDVQNGKMVINKDEAKIIREIFDLLVKEKKSQTEIAKILTARKVPTKADTKGVKRRTNSYGFWGQSSISDILIKDEYSGTYYYGKRETILDDNGKKKQVLRPKEEWIPLDCPEIITDTKIFKRAQEIAKANQSYSLRDSDHLYLLRSNVYCGECGGRFQGYPKKKNGVVYFQYRCNRGNTSKNDKPCTNRDMSEIKLEAKVWGPIEALLKDPKQYLKALERKLKKESRLTEYEGQLIELEGKMKEKDKERKPLIDALKRGTLTPKDYDEAIANTNAEADIITSEITRITALRDGEKEKEQMLNSLEKLAAIFQKKYKNLDKQIKEGIVRLLIHSVTVYKDGRVKVEHKIPKIDNQLWNHGGDAGS